MVFDIKANLNTIIHADCLDILREIPDKAIDLVLCDPPYGEQTHKGAIKNKNKDLQVDFDCVDESYIIYLAQELLRISKAWVIFTCEWRFLSPLEKSFPEEFIRFGVWTKPSLYSATFRR